MFSAYTWREVYIRLAVIEKSVTEGKRKTQAAGRGGCVVGDDLVSRELALRVPSAQVGLTTGFEKGPGVPPPP